MGPPVFLNGGGDMGARVRAQDWSMSPLGRSSDWPQSLRTALSVMLNSAFPSYLVWGPEQISFYNDAYVPILGTKPDALGRPFREVWSEVWDKIAPIAARAMAGEASYFEDFPLTLTRRGSPEQTWFTFSYSPIRDESGGVGGVLCTVQETTARIAGERERERLLQELAAERGRIVTLIENLPFAAGMFDANGHVIAGNPALHAFLPRGLAPSRDLDVRSEWTGYDGAGAILTVPKDLVSRALKGQAVQNVAFVHRAPGSGERWMNASCIPIPDAGDSTSLAILVIQDVDEQKRAELALREREAQLAAAVNLVGLSTYTWNPATDALSWDSRLKAMWGLPPGAHVDFNDFRAGIHPEDRDRVDAAIARCTDPAGDGVYHLEYRVIGADDGVERWVSTHGQTYFRGDRAAWFVGAALDVTERKRAEERLRESEERLRRFAEYSADVLWVLDLETDKFELLSAAYERIWGAGVFSPSARDRSSWLNSIHLDDRERVIHGQERVRQGEVITHEYRIVHADGIIRRIRETSFPIRDDNGQVQQQGGIAEDVTEFVGSPIYVVDDDESARQDLTRTLRTAGYDAKEFKSASSFLEVAPLLVAGCVILNTRSSGSASGGLTVPKELKARRIALPVIVIGTSGGDVRAAVQAMKAGAVDWVEAPYEPEAIFSAIALAIADIRAVEERDRSADVTSARIAQFSTREREVLEGLLGGGTNKSIAKNLGISPRTVEIHRAHVMELLGAKTLFELVAMAIAAGLKPSG
ncbi:PAS domain S-box protein [Sabulicella rubraurantiaca]|uniref:PAS domain S-box protein n=1 Tax=Sabulicella rubraurantiaca TaxID=2811429 RepID=UPI001A975E45|nr:PAS domain S-box protein [Sabulicella rubraurantiaca]